VQAEFDHTLTTCRVMTVTPTAGARMDGVSRRDARRWDSFDSPAASTMKTCRSGGWPYLRFAETGHPYLAHASLLPRIKQINKAKLYRPDRDAAHPALEPATTRAIRWDIIENNYEMLIKYATVQTIERGGVQLGQRGLGRSDDPAADRRLARRTSDPFHLLPDRFEPNRVAARRQAASNRSIAILPNTSVEENSS